MVITPHKQILIKQSTSQALDKLKIIPEESYDSVIVRMINQSSTI